MHEQTPISVLMAVRNGEPFLKAAVESIFNQTFGDFRFVIVDDASTDATREIILSYNDPRVDLICLERNIGQTAALNVGLRYAGTPWIARMDADDVSAPNRLEEQWNTVKADASLDCVGTFAWLFEDEPGKVVGVRVRPLDYEAIRWESLRSTPMVHGSLLIRRQALLDVGGYDERYRYSADRELYHRFLPKYRAINIPKQLLGVRQHAGQGSLSRTAADESIAIISRELARHGMYSKAQQRVLRTSLAHTYRYRARYWLSERLFGNMFKDLAQALRLAPLDSFRRSSGNARNQDIATTPQHPLAMPESVEASQVG